MPRARPRESNASPARRPLADSPAPYSCPAPRGCRRPWSGRSCPPARRAALEALPRLEAERREDRVLVRLRLVKRLVVDRRGLVAETEEVHVLDPGEARADGADQARVAEPPLAQVRRPHVVVAARVQQREGLHVRPRVPVEAPRRARHATADHQRLVGLPPGLRHRHRPVAVVPRCPVQQPQIVLQGPLHKHRRSIVRSKYRKSGQVCDQNRCGRERAPGFPGDEGDTGICRGLSDIFRVSSGRVKSCGHDPLKLAQDLFELQPDLIAEIQHEKKLKRISNLADFESIIHECLTTKEMWKDYTNIFLSKNAALPAEMRRLLGRETA